MNDPSESSKLGSWENDDFIRTIKDTTGIGVDCDLPNWVRFQSGVAKLIRKRIREDKSEADSHKPAVFLLHPNVNNINLQTHSKRAPMLDNGLTVITGRLWFVSEVAVTGHYISLEVNDDDEIFKIVTDSLQLGDVPAIIFDPRTKDYDFRFYPKGLFNSETCQITRILNPDLSLTNLFEIIDRIHHSDLVTPEAQGKHYRLWEDPSRFIPVTNPEGMVQKLIKVGLSASLPSCHIREEQTDTSGRLDLLIEQADIIENGVVTLHAVLELKVLRCFWSSGKPVPESDNLAAITKGVKQAVIYRKERGALASALCCFDMRTFESGENCFDDVREMAAEAQVVLKLWFIYTSSELYRNREFNHLK